MSLDPSKAIAIIGMGARLPGAESVEQYRRNLRDKVAAISEVQKDRWDPEIYYHPDPKVPDKSYSKIGGFLEPYRPNYRNWRIPPKVAENLDSTQILALSVTHEALIDSGYLDRDFDRSRCGVVLGNSMGGDLRDYSASRLALAGFLRDLERSEGFKTLTPVQRASLLQDVEKRVLNRHPVICEDTMAGELANVVAGRVAAAYKLTGLNFTVDAACASSLAAVTAAVQNLRARECDMVITGGVDRNMSVNSFVKFCKTNALSPDRSTPFDEGANGFVMGEGGGILVLKRLEDAWRDGDKIRGVIIGCGGSSDGGGRGITAPNPQGQAFALERAYHDAGVSPATVGFIEAHGTSTKVGDDAEVRTMGLILKDNPPACGAVPVSSSKSMFGHLKSAAGAAGLVKATLALENKEIYPMLGFEKPNTALCETKPPIRIPVELEEWNNKADMPRRAGVSAFGFGGTNFHLVLQERMDPRKTMVGGSMGGGGGSLSEKSNSGKTGKISAMATKESNGETSRATTKPTREATTKSAIGATTGATKNSQLMMERGIEMKNKLNDKGFEKGFNGAESFVVGENGVEPHEPVMLRGVGVFRLGARDKEELVGEIDRVLTHMEKGGGLQDLAQIMGNPVHQKPLRLAITAGDKEELAARLKDARQLAMTGKGGLKLAGKGTFLGVDDASPKAFLFPGQGSQYVGMLKDLLYIDVVRETIAEADEVMFPILKRPLSDYMFGDESAEIKGAPAGASAAEAALRQTMVTQPAVLTADIAILRALEKIGIKPDMVAGHSLGEYAACVAAGVMGFPQALRVVAARGREMTDAVPEGGDPGLMAVVSGPSDVVEAHLDGISGYVVAANKNSPNQTVIAGSSAAVEEAIESFQKEGFTCRTIPVSHAFHTRVVAAAMDPLRKVLERSDVTQPSVDIFSNVTAELYPEKPEDIVALLARQVASPVEFIEIVRKMYSRGARTFVEIGPKRALFGFVRDILSGKPHRAVLTNHPKKGGPRSFAEAVASLAAEGSFIAPTTWGEEKIMRYAFTGSGSPSKGGQGDKMTKNNTVGNGAVGNGNGVAGTSILDESDSVRDAGADIWITGAAVGLPGREKVFDDKNMDELLDGNIFLSELDESTRGKIAGNRIVRLVKSEDGTGELRPIESADDVMTWAGRGGKLDVQEEYLVPADWDKDKDPSTRLAVGAAFEALRDAWLPLVEVRKKISNGKTLSLGWRLPEKVGNETGVIFASAFSGHTRILNMVEEAKEGKPFPRSALLQMLAIGHAHVAELLGAYGPNLQINTACASTTTAMSIAQDWIRMGRCRRVLIIAGDDVTSDELLPWVGGGFLAVGAATTERQLDKAAIPFGAKRNGLILGMGAVGLVVERAETAKSRGIRPLARMLDSLVANSGSHPMRLRPEHIADQMDDLVGRVCKRLNISRKELAEDVVFMSHETYTPARGGSAQAEADALRRAFGEHVNRVKIVNTKGFTGHTMAVGLEDGLLPAGLYAEKLPKVANLKDPDPEFADLSFHRGGKINRRFAIRLAAGFGSQLAMYVLQRGEGFGMRVDEEVFRKHAEEVYSIRNGELVLDRRTLRARSEYRSSDKDMPDALSEAVRADSRIRSQDRTQFGPSQYIEIPKAVAAEEVKQVVSGEVAVSAEEVLQRLMEVVSVKTGYDLEELEGDLELEADLGVDTVKQAEIMAQVREEYGMGRDESFRLSDYPTLEAMAGYVAGQVRGVGEGVGGGVDKKVEGEGVRESTEKVEVKVKVEVKEEVKEEVEKEIPAEATAGAGEEERAVSAGEVLQRLMEVVSVKTGYDLEELEGDLELEADLGVDTVKQAEIMAQVREEYGMGRDESFRLSDYPTLEAMAGYVAGQVRGVGEGVGGGVDKKVEGEGVRATTKKEEAKAEAKEEAKEERSMDVAPPVEAKVAVNAEEVLQRLMEVVSVKTGYDIEELEGDLELEADLGVDTVKQAEIMAQVREEYGMGRDESFRLSDYPTLEAMAHYVATNITTVATRVDETSAHTAENGGADESTADMWDLDDGFLIRRVASDGLNIDQREREDEEGTVPFENEVDWVFVAPDTHRGDCELLLKKLTRGRRVNSIILDWKRLGDMDEASLTEHLKHNSAAGKWGVLCMVPSSMMEEPVGTIYGAFRLAKVLALNYTGEDAENGPLVAAWVSVFSTNHGDTPRGPFAGSLAGLTRALGREWPSCDACEIPVADDLLVTENMGASEREEMIGERSKRIRSLVSRCMRGETAQTLSKFEGSPRLNLSRDAVVLITGALGGLGALTARLVHKLWGCRLVLLDRVPRPRDPADCKVPTRKELRNGFKSAGKRATPRMLDAELDRLERESAAGMLLKELEQGGGSDRLLYISADLRNEKDIQRFMEEINSQWGRLDMVIHGAGVEISQPLTRKSDEEIQLVMGAKTEAAKDIYETARRVFGKPVKRMISYGSVAGVLGNPGQTDYSAANAGLGGLAAQINGSRDDSTALVIHWTGWDGLGMTRFSWIRESLESRGLDLLPQDKGVEAMSRLFSSQASGEVLVSGRLGELEPHLEEEQDNQNGALQESENEKRNAKVVEKTVFLDTSSAWLADHSIEGTPVLPGVVGTEFMAQAVSKLAGESIGSMELVGLRFHKALRVSASRRTEARVRAWWTKVGERAEALLESITHGKKGEVTRKHFTAEFCFNGLGLENDHRDTCEISGEEPLDVGFLKGAGPDHEEIYKYFFHGPAFQVLEEVKLVGERGLVARGGNRELDLPDLLDMEGSSSMVAPLALEAAFQAAGFHCLMTDRTSVLPTGVGRMRWVDSASIERGDPWIVRVVRIPSEAAGGVSQESGSPAVPQDEKSELFLFNAHVLNEEGALLMVVENLEMAGREAVNLSRVPSLKPIMEVMELSLARLGGADRLVVDLAREMSQGERKQVAQIEHAGRRLEWIAGRLAAKEAVRCHLRDHFGKVVGRRDVEIATESGGAPIAWIPSRPEIGHCLPALSITHACGRAIVLSLPSSEPRCRVGVDLVSTERRDESFVRQWLSENERALIEDLDNETPHNVGSETKGAPGLLRREAVAIMWGIKEAVSKSLGLGLHLTSAEMEITELYDDNRASVKLSGEALRRYDSLRGSAMNCGWKIREGVVTAWAVLELKDDDREGIEEANGKVNDSLQSLPLSSYRL